MGHWGQTLHALGVRPCTPGSDPARPWGQTLYALTCAGTAIDRCGPFGLSPFSKISIMPTTHERIQACGGQLVNERTKGSVTETTSFVPVVLTFLVLLGAITGAVHQGLTALQAREAQALANEALADEALARTAMVDDGAPGGAEQPHMAFDQARDSAHREAESAERNAARLIVIAAITSIAATAMLLNSRRRERGLTSTLGRQAATDLLTGLPNRRHLQHSIDEARGQMFETGCHTGLLYLDLDGFKNVNDTLGHDAGDQLLVTAAARLSSVKRSNERLVRLGGDEFAVLLTGIGSLEDAHLAARRYFRSFDQPCEIRGRKEFLRASIGVSATSDPDHIDELHSEADMAMYDAKRDSTKTIGVFSTEMRTEAESIDAITRALRGADLDRELFLVYQPIVDVDVNEPFFVEALLRWDSPSLGLVIPDEFIPLAEQTGEIHAIGNWVLRNVIDQLARWESHPVMQGVSLSCNVSAIQLADRNFVASVLDLLRVAGVPPDRLILEVTETVALDVDGGAMNVLRHLRSAGLRIAIDDFGSGYTNLGQLLEVPFDILKLDRSLLMRLTAMRDNSGGDPTMPCEIMSAISRIASQLGAKIVCEGVEQEQQRTSLGRSGVTHIQGWLVGKPESAEDFAPDWVVATLT